MQSLAFSQSLVPLGQWTSPSPVTAINRRSFGSFQCTRSGRSLRCCALQAPCLVADKAKFMDASTKGNLIPLHKCIFSDHLTPVLAYRCLIKEDDKEAPSFLFESVEKGFRASSVGRYSVIGAQPAMEVIAKENKVTILDYDKGSLTEKMVDDPMEIPRSISESWRPQFIDDLPDTFCGTSPGDFMGNVVVYVLSII